MNTISFHSIEPSIGDIVSVDKGFFKHLGVVIQGGILQTSPGSHERVVSWDEFSQGRSVTITRTRKSAFIVMQRARAILSNPRAYDVLTQNCEHTVNDVVYGAPRSPQACSFFVGMLMGFLIVSIAVR